jgi:hypothetical protein
MFHSKFRVFRRTQIVGVCLLSFCLSLWCGCSKDEIKKMATSVQETTQDFAAQSQEYIQDAVEAVEEQLPATGSVQLRLEPELQVNSASVEVIKIGDGRSNVMQLATYDTSADPTEYPAVLLHGHTRANSASALVGETIACDLYIQTAYGAEMLMTTAGSSVQVTFGRIDPKQGTVSARIGSGSLLSTADKRVRFNGGDIVALLNGDSK